MKRFLIDVFGVSLEVSLNGREPISQLFPSLYILPHTSSSKVEWRIEVSCVENVSEDFIGPSAFESLLHIYPDTDIKYRLDEARNLHASTEGAVLSVSPERKLATLQYQSEAIINAEKLGRFAIGEILRYAGSYMIHAGAVEFKGGAILICAAPGMGKSTMTAAWGYSGRARFMSDDMCVIFRRAGVLWTGGIPDKLALSPKSEEILKALGVRMPAVIDSFEQKRQYDCHKFFVQVCSDPYPVKAVIFLVDENNFNGKIRTCLPETAGELLLKQSFYVGDSHVMRDHFETVLDLVTQAPSYLVPHGLDFRMLLPEIERVIDRGPHNALPVHPCLHRRFPSVTTEQLGPLMTKICQIISGPASNYKTSNVHDTDWEDILKVADHYGLLALVGKALQKDNSLCRLDSTLQNVILADILHASDIRQIHLTMIKQMADAFKQADIQWSVINGPSIAERFYEFPETRLYHHLDVMAVSVSEQKTVGILREIGYVPLREYQHGHIPEVGAGNIFIKNEASQYQVYLHSDFNTLTYMKRKVSIDVLDILDRAEMVQMQDMTIPVAALHDQLILSCLCASTKQQWDRILFLLDIAFMMDRASKETFEKVYEEADRMTCMNIVVSLLNRSIGLFPLKNLSTFPGKPHPVPCARSLKMKLSDNI